MSVNKNNIYSLYNDSSYPVDFSDKKLKELSRNVDIIETNLSKFVDLHRKFRSYFVKILNNLTSVKRLCVNEDVTIREGDIFIYNNTDKCKVERALKKNNFEKILEKVKSEKSEEKLRDFRKYFLHNNNDKIQVEKSFLKGYDSGYLMTEDQQEENIYTLYKKPNNFKVIKHCSSFDYEEVKSDIENGFRIRSQNSKLIFTEPRYNSQSKIKKSLEELNKNINNYLEITENIIEDLKEYVDFYHNLLSEKMKKSFKVEIAIMNLS